MDLKTSYANEVKVDNKMKHSITKYSLDIRNMTVPIVYAAVAVAGTTALILIPNLELLSFFFFLAAYRYGFKTGINTVFLAVPIYEFVAAQIWGSAGVLFVFKFPPYILLVYLASKLGEDYRNTRKKLKINFNTLESAVVGKKTTDNEVNAIETARKDTNMKKSHVVILSKTQRHPPAIIFGLFGLGVTAFYDVFTSLTFLLFTRFTFTALMVAFFFGIPFYVFHEVTNFIIFLQASYILNLLDDISPQYNQ